MLTRRNTLSSPTFYPFDWSAMPLQSFPRLMHIYWSKLRFLPTATHSEEYESQPF